MIGFFPASEVQTERPVGLIPKCGACGLFKTCHSPKIAPYGEGREGVLIVGEAPGETEDRKGRPFVGKAGKLLRQTLSRIGVNLDRDAVTTNALICRPPHNRKPDEKEIGYCRPNLLSAIKENTPRVVITLGRAALSAVLPDYWKSDIGIMERWAGWHIPVSNHWICPTFHPSYVLRSNNPLLERVFANHLEAAFAITNNPSPFRDFTLKVTKLYNEEEVWDALREVDQAAGWAAFDFESNCLKPEYPKARLVSCAVSTGETTVAYPWSGKAIRATQLFLRSNRTRKIGANIKMEERWCRKVFGHGVNNWGWDSMLGTHCLDNRAGICSLKFQTFVGSGVPSYNENIEPYLQNVRGPYNRIEEIALPTLLYYNGLDALFTRRLAFQQMRIMRAKI